VLVYGDDLSDADRQELQAVLGARADASVEAVWRQELADALSAAPSDEAISSAALTCQDPSAGLAVRTLHITRVPASAYAGALLTAGLRGASVTVAAPASKPVSGEAALVGLLKAAATCLGHPADPRRVQLAYQQLDLLSTLANDSPDLNDASELLLRLLRGAVTGQPADTVVEAEGTHLDDRQRAAAMGLLDQLRRLDYGPYARGFYVQQNEPVESSYAILPNR
jgi:uncharacterized protein YpuA (DUF1002 family)